MATRISAEAHQLLRANRRLVGSEAKDIQPNEGAGWEETY